MVMYMLRKLSAHAAVYAQFSSC